MYGVNPFYRRVVKVKLNSNGKLSPAVPDQIEWRITARVVGRVVRGEDKRVVRRVVDDNGKESGKRKVVRGRWLRGDWLVEWVGEW